nr:hypothetical protein 1 [bacterium]
MSQLTGEWKGFENDLVRLKTTLLTKLKLATVQNAEITKKSVVKHLQNQDLGWDKLSKKYLARKKKQGLSTATLIATSQLMQSITTQASSNKMSAFVGVLRTAKRRGGGKAVLIAAIHEFGSKRRKIPARPLFRPTLQEVKPQIANRYREALNEALKTLV